MSQHNLLNPHTKFDTLNNVTVDTQATYQGTTDSLRNILLKLTKEGKRLIYGVENGVKNSYGDKSNQVKIFYLKCD